MVTRRTASSLASAPRCGSSTRSGTCLARAGISAAPGRRPRANKRVRVRPGSSCRRRKSKSCLRRSSTAWTSRPGRRRDRLSGIWRRFVASSSAAWSLMWQRRFTLTRRSSCVRPAESSRSARSPSEPWPAYASLTHTTAASSSGNPEPIRWSRRQRRFVQPIIACLKVEAGAGERPKSELRWAEWRRSNTYGFSSQADLRLLTNSK